VKSLTAVIVVPKALGLGVQRLDDITLVWCAFSPFAKNVPSASHATYG